MDSIPTKPLEEKDQNYQISILMMIKMKYVESLKGKIP